MSNVVFMSESLTFYTNVNSRRARDLLCSPLCLQKNTVHLGEVQLLSLMDVCVVLMTRMMTHLTK